MTTTNVTTGTLGFPRMGPKRELKFALETYWKSSLTPSDEAELCRVADTIEHDSWMLQKKAGMDRITVGDYYLYDGVLQWTEMLGLSIPTRFQELTPGLPRLFAMARGIDEAPALSMKKWVTSNYHYMVPEYDEASPSLPHNFTSFLQRIQQGKATLGADCATPVVMGPVTMARLARTKSTDSMIQLLNAMLPIYAELLNQMGDLGFTEIQIHEPVLVFDEENILPLFKAAYPAIIRQVVTTKNVNINMVSFMEDVGEKNYEWLISQPEIGTISLDLSAARSGRNLDFIEKYGFPASKTLGAGIVDARNVWKVIPSEVMPVLTKLAAAKITSIRIQPSGSLQYCPWDFALETSANIKSHPAANVLAFAVQKLDEVSHVAKAFHNPALFQGHEAAWKAFSTARSQALSPHAITNAQRLHNLTEADLARPEPYKVRRHKQLTDLPPLPTTTIGSFPQTTEIRRLRAQWKKGSLTDEEYKAGIDQQIAFCIGIQEAIGLDVLVHGEAERTDMVEFFAQQMEGMLFTSHGWVQSFGSRCVRPPIFWNDIVRPTPMTVREFVVAQKLTKKPVKGMLTGPITILNWSFPRADITRKEQAFQIGLCIRDEIADLEVAGCRVIQVDEPALREGMPLRAGAKDEYLHWAVDSFRLATAGAKNETQIQTHMCYCEFKDCMGAIDRMDTDVNSIENSRSDNATLEAFRSFGYDKGFGPGTYDIHSPVVPSVQHQKEKIESFLEVLEVGNVVVNPDCGLKTRTWPETISALRNMVAATETVRAERGLL